MKYKKKPVVIDCFMYDGDLMDSKGNYYVPNWAEKAFKNGNVYYGKYKDMHGELFVRTLEGSMHVCVGDYIIKGVQGELYPCKPDIFEQTYEAVENE